MNDLKIAQLRLYVETKLSEIVEAFAEMNESTHRLGYWEMKFRVDFYQTIMNKFFYKKEDDFYNTSEERLEDILDYCNQRIDMFEAYSKTRNYKLENEYDVEAFEMTNEAKFVINEYLSKVDDNIDISPIINDTNQVKEKPVFKSPNLIAKESFDSLTLLDKITILYSNVKDKAVKKDGELDGLLYTYITTMFDPATTELNDMNLFLNLSVIDNILTYTNLSWDFDTELQVSQENIYTNDKKYESILNSDISSDMKHVSISEKKLLAMVNTHCLKQLVEHGDRKSINIEEYKLEKFLAESQTEMGAEEFYVQKMLKLSDDTASIYITKDLASKLDISYNPHTNIKSEVIEYLGEWNNRSIYKMDTENIPRWEKATYTALVMNDGNNMYVNPEKPIVYIEILDNPMLNKPVIYMFYSMKMEFFQSKSLMYQVLPDYFDSF